MARTKSGTATNKKRKKILQYTKGFRWGRKSKFRSAKEALLHSWSYSFRDRKVRKRDFRRMWQIKINAATRNEGVSYSDFIHLLKKKEVGLNRKMLAEIAENHPDIYKEVVSFVKE